MSRKRGGSWSGRRICERIASGRENRSIKEVNPCEEILSSLDGLVGELEKKAKFYEGQYDCDQYIAQGIREARQKIQSIIDKHRG